MMDLRSCARYIAARLETCRVSAFDGRSGRSPVTNDARRRFPGDMTGRDMIARRVLRMPGPRLLLLAGITHYIQ